MTWLHSRAALQSDPTKCNEPFTGLRTDLTAAIKSSVLGKQSISFNKLKNEALSWYSCCPVKPNKADGAGRILDPSIMVNVTTWYQAAG